MSNYSVDQASGQKRGRRLSPRLKRALLIAAVVLGAGGVAIQFVPVKGIGVNPEERYVVKAPPEVLAVLQKACFDCHTNETRWPWYAKIAPGSWLMASDVKKGRAHMNMSEWTDDDPDARHLDMENAWDEIAEGNMPPWFYQVMPNHFDAFLSDKEKELLKGWLLAHKTTAPSGKQASTGSQPAPPAGAN
jgi:Haem-binding domain